MSHKIEITGYTATHCGNCWKRRWATTHYICGVYEMQLFPDGPYTNRCKTCIADEKAQRENKMTEHARHTPGPWEARKGAGWYVARPRYGEATLAVGMEAVTLVTSPSETPWNDDVESEANARLIAAAPELLEACERYDKIMRDFWGSPESLPAEYVDALDVWPRMIAAIAKAKGGI